MCVCMCVEVLVTWLQVLLVPNGRGVFDFSLWGKWKVLRIKFPQVSVLWQIIFNIFQSKVLFIFIFMSAFIKTLDFFSVGLRLLRIMGTLIAIKSEQNYLEMSLHLASVSKFKVALRLKSSWILEASPYVFSPHILLNVTTVPMGDHWRLIGFLHVCVLDWWKLFLLWLNRRKCCFQKVSQHVKW